VNATEQTAAEAAVAAVRDRRTVEEMERYLQVEIDRAEAEAADIAARHGHDDPLAVTGWAMREAYTRALTHLRHLMNGGGE
jgi:regulator of protease activity HflC (stomatin/prohibitin superfamily)